METSKGSVGSGSEAVNVENRSLVEANRERRTVEEKRRIVEETMAEGASVARVARARGVNANQVFHWRKLYRAGRLGGSGAVKLLPVKVSEESSPPTTSLSSEQPGSTPLRGTIHIDLRHAQVHIEGGADPVLLRVLMECLRR